MLPRPDFALVDPGLQRPLMVLLEEDTAPPGGRPPYGPWWKDLQKQQPSTATPTDQPSGGPVVPTPQEHPEPDWLAVPPEGQSHDQQTQWYIQQYICQRQGFVWEGSTCRTWERASTGCSQSQVFDQVAGGCRELQAVLQEAEAYAACRQQGGLIDVSTGACHPPRESSASPVLWGLGLTAVAVGLLVATLQLGRNDPEPAVV